MQRLTWHSAKLELYRQSRELKGVCRGRIFPRKGIRVILFWKATLDNINAIQIFGRPSIYDLLYLFFSIRFCRIRKIGRNMGSWSTSTIHRFEKGALFVKKLLIGDHIF